MQHCIQLQINIHTTRPLIKFTLLQIFPPTVITYDYQISISSSGLLVALPISLPVIVYHVPIKRSIKSSNKKLNSSHYIPRNSTRPRFQLSITTVVNEK